MDEKGKGVTVKDAILQVLIDEGETPTRRPPCSCCGPPRPFTPLIQIAERVNQNVRVGTPYSSVRRAIRELVADGLAEWWDGRYRASYTSSQISRYLRDGAGAEAN